MLILTYWIPNIIEPPYYYPTSDLPNIVPANSPLLQNVELDEIPFFSVVFLKANVTTKENINVYVRNIRERMILDVVDEIEIVLNSVGYALNYSIPRFLDYYETSFLSVTINDKPILLTVNVEKGQLYYSLPPLHG